MRKNFTFLFHRNSHSKRHQLIKWRAEGKPNKVLIMMEELHPFDFRRDFHSSRVETVQSFVYKGRIVLFVPVSKSEVALVPLRPWPKYATWPQPLPPPSPRRVQLTENRFLQPRRNQECEFFPRCVKGGACTFAHGIRELPADTAVCFAYNFGRCRRGERCRYLHVAVRTDSLGDQIDAKTRLCFEFVNTGTCQLGGACSRAHSVEELRLKGCVFHFVRDEDVAGKTTLAVAIAAAKVARKEIAWGARRNYPTK